MLLGFMCVRNLVPKYKLVRSVFEVVVVIVVNEASILSQQKCKKLLKQCFVLHNFAVL